MTTVFISRESDGFIIKFQSDDPGAFKLLVETLKSFVQSDLRRYSPATKRWRIEPRALVSVHRWATYARERIHAQVEWLDGEGEAAKEEGSSTPPPRVPQQKPDTYAVLHLLPSAPPELIKAAYRTLAQLHHPDHGGDTSAMQRINIAYKEIGAHRI